MGSENKVPLRDVEGKTAFITGGDSGIGLGIARACADAGMNVVITYRSPTHLDEAMAILKDAGNRVHAINVDVTDRAGMAAAAAETVRVFGKVHLLVNNAGVFSSTPLSNATFDDWDWCMSVNVNGVFNGVRAFLPHIRAQGEGGHVVATASVFGGLIAGISWGVYSTSKFAVVGMMESLRSELVNANVGVSIFCPGSVKTNVGDSKRNRPPSLKETGSPDPVISSVMAEFGSAVRGLMETHGGSLPMMDPFEAGRCVLQGVRNNDLYIMSHPEYEIGLRDRNEAILASIRSEELSDVRKELGRISRNRIYTQAQRPAATS